MRNEQKIVFFVTLLLAGQFYGLRYYNFYVKIMMRENYKQMHASNVQSRMAVEKGKGCSMARTNPFADEITIFIRDTEKIICDKKGWVDCEGSHCFINKKVLDFAPMVECYFSDIILIDDDIRVRDTPVRVVGNEKYELNKSDHVHVICYSDKRFPHSLWAWKWQDVKTGFRSVKVDVPKGREDSLNVLVLSINSVSHNHFLRMLPKSYQMLTDELGAVVLNNYNVIGSETSDSLLPILTGKTEFELPDSRKSTKIYFDPQVFLFGQLRNDGYQTAYFEDFPEMGTFQRRFNGFKRRPADRYLRDFFLEANTKSLCVGNMLSHVFLLNKTRQFTKETGKRFSLTVITETEGNFNYLKNIEDDLLYFLTSLRADGTLNDTLVIVMSDHGSRYFGFSMTNQGRIEERLPFMALILPEKLKKARPDADKHLKTNADVLTTPFDIHTTILDIVGLKNFANEYKVPGSNLTRAMTLIEPISANRSCAEADILSYWCACTSWINLLPNDTMYLPVANNLAKYINLLVSDNPKCLNRTISRIDWVKEEVLNEDIMSAISFSSYYLQPQTIEFLYEAQITMTPFAVFVGKVIYNVIENRFLIAEGNVTRVDDFSKEGNCVIDTEPHLSKFCYCKS